MKALLPLAFGTIVLSCEIFTLDCSGVDITVDIDEQCVRDEYPNLVDNFAESIYVVSKEADHSTQLKSVMEDDTDMFSKCTPTGSFDDNDLQIKFNVDQCILDDNNDLSHHVVNTDDDNLIKYNYFIKHQRLVGTVAISAMSPKPITCQIDSTINVSIANQAVEEQDVDVVTYATEINPTDAMELRVKNKDGTDSYKVGDEARLSIEVKSDYEFGSGFAEEFKFGFKSCTAKGNGDVKVAIIENFCASSLFKGMINHDSDANYDNEREFNSFIFNVFKFPETQSVDFECVITVCHEETPSSDCWKLTDSSALDLTADNCVNDGTQLWTDPATSRERRAETSDDGHDYMLKATIDFKPKTSAESNAATVVVALATLLLTLL